MTTASITTQEVQDLLSQAIQPLWRQQLMRRIPDVLLEVLLWARWLPTSEEGRVGYFDALHPLGGLQEWIGIREEITRRSGVPPLELSEKVIPILESLRGILLPLAQVLNRGEAAAVRILVDVLRSLKADYEPFGAPPAVAMLWEALLSDQAGEPVACLYELGIDAAPLLVQDHPILLHTDSEQQHVWIRGLMSLYPHDTTPASIADHPTWALAIAVPSWASRSRELLEEDPWLPPGTLDCPETIREPEARRVYAAHQRCTGTTYALVSPGLGFGTVRGLDHFREELVRRHWLDAVVALPTGALFRPGIGGLLLVLRQDRQPDAPVQIVDATQLLAPYQSRSRSQTWQQDAVAELVQTLRERRECAYSRLVPVSELEENAFTLQTNRYLFSDTDLTLLQYLDRRETRQLGDLAEISRPVGAIGRQTEEGTEVWEATPGDVDEAGFLTQASRSVCLSDAALAKSRQYLLESGDVVMSIKGSLGKVGVVQDLTQATLPNQAFCVIRLRPNAPLSPLALAQYLRSAVGQHLINRAAQGAGVPFIPMGDLKSLPIVLPTEDEAQRSCALEQEQTEQVTVLRTARQTLEATTTQGWLNDLPPDLILATDSEN